MPGLRGRPRSPVLAWDPLRRGLPWVGCGRRAGGRGPASPPAPKMPVRFAARRAPTTTRGPARLLPAAEAATAPHHWHTVCRRQARPEPPLRGYALRLPLTGRRKLTDRLLTTRTLRFLLARPEAEWPSTARFMGRAAAVLVAPLRCRTAPGWHGPCSVASTRCANGGDSGRRWPLVGSASRAVRGRQWPLPYATLPACRYPPPSPPTKTP